MNVRSAVCAPRIEPMKARRSPGRVGSRPLGGFQVSLERVALELPVRFGQKLVLSGEVVPQQPGCNAGALGNTSYRRTVVPVPSETRQRRVDEFLTPSGRVAASHVGGSSGMRIPGYSINRGDESERRRARRSPDAAPRSTAIERRCTMTSIDVPLPDPDRIGRLPPAGNTARGEATTSHQRGRPNRC